jgi:REP element-mobilizing transposase RayT
MTAPRQVLAGVTYLVTRRCAGRRFLLKPGPIVNAIFRFVLARAVALFGMELHAFAVMSNHYHLVLTDPAARLPAFMQYLDSLVARAVNASRACRDHFWDGEPYSAVVLATAEDILAKAVYTLANPVAAGLVRWGREWPGLWSPPDLLTSHPLPAPRPEGFFRREGPLPARLELRLVAPPGFASARSFQRELAIALDAEEDRLAQGRSSFLGIGRIMAQKWWARPAQPEPWGQLSPLFAGHHRSTRLDLLERLRAFRAAYHEAWRAWRSGLRAVEFPAGTYALRVLHGVACAAPS